MAELVDCTGLENRRLLKVRGFESYSHCKKTLLDYDTKTMIGRRTWCQVYEGVPDVMRV